MSNREPIELIFADETPPRRPRTPVTPHIPFRTPTNPSSTPFTPPETPPATPPRHSTPNATPGNGRSIKSLDLIYKSKLLAKWMIDIAYASGAR